MQQWNKPVYEYVAEFLRLSQFAQYMVEDEEKRASRFQQGLKMDIQIVLIPQQLKTYSLVLTIAKDVERGLEKKNRTQIQNKVAKRPFHQMYRGNPVRLWVPRWPSNHFSQFDLLIFSLYATIARSLDILVRIAEWRIGCVWPVAPVTTIWEIVYTREHRTPPHPYQHF